ncbi:MAG: ATPase [Ardenticatenia bacterium]|nr:MAG: ATPase [Ardenticatenia bacterium]
MTSLRRSIRPEQVRELILVLVIVVLVFFFGTQIEGYYSSRTFIRISTSIAILAVVAVGETLVFLTRNYDISVGSIVGLTAFFVGTQLNHYPGIPPIAALLMALGLGAIMGAFNGVLVAYGRVPAIIVTLGTMAIYRAMLVEYPGIKIVQMHLLPSWAQEFSRVNIIQVGDFELRLIVGIALAVVIIFQLVLTYLPYGRRLYAIGSNPDAARIAGFPYQRIVFIAFVLSGTLAGLAGFMFMGRFGNLTVGAAMGMEMQAIAAVVVGGTSTMGGVGSAFGTLLGAALIGLLDQSLLRWPLISEFWRDAILGLLILLAVAGDRAIVDRLRTLWARSELQLRPSIATARQEDSVHGS